MNIEMEKKVKAYEARIKDMEEKYVHTITQLDRFQPSCGMWKTRNVSMKIAEAGSTKFNDPPMSFYNGMPYP
jgi:hypothetical protein